MTDQTPKEPGLYWALVKSYGGCEPVRVIDLGVRGMRVQCVGFSSIFDLNAFTWGPRITLPDELEGVK